MAMTVEELAAKLDMEIAARKLLERKLEAQSGSMANIENRLGNQITSATAALEARMKATEGMTASEATLRSDGDDALRASISSNATAIKSEAEARASADDVIRQQVQADLAAVMLLQSAVKSYKTDVDNNTKAVMDEATAREEGHQELTVTINKVAFDAAQTASTLQTALDNLTSRTNELSEQLLAEGDARKTTDINVQSNLDTINKANQDISSIKDELSNMNEKFLDESAVTGLINESFEGNFTNQVQYIHEILDTDKQVRDADIANIQECAQLAQNVGIQVQNYFDDFTAQKSEMFLKMREAFNLLLPKGTILPYAGEISKIPDGWVLCNGGNNTPDLVGKVLVGAHAVTEDNDAEFVLGKEGGEKEVSLSASNMPAHYHYTGIINDTNKGAMFIDGTKASGKQITIKDAPLHDDLWGIRSWDGCGDSSYIYSKDMMIEEGTSINAITSNQVTDKAAKPHNNMQPYYCVYYIMKMF